MVGAHLVDGVDDEPRRAGRGDAADRAADGRAEEPRGAERDQRARGRARLLGGRPRDPGSRPGQHRGQHPDDRHHADDREDGDGHALGVADDLGALRQVGPVAEHVEGAAQVEVEAQPERAEHGQRGHDHADHHRRCPPPAARQHDRERGQRDALDGDPGEVAGRDPVDDPGRGQGDPEDGDRRQGEHPGRRAGGAGRQRRVLGVVPVPPLPHDVVAEGLDEEEQRDRQQGAGRRVGEEGRRGDGQHDALHGGDHLRPVARRGGPAQPRPGVGGEDVGVAHRSDRQHPPAEQGSHVHAQDGDQEGVGLHVEARTGGAHGAGTTRDVPVHRVQHQRHGAGAHQHRRPPLVQRRDEPAQGQRGHPERQHRAHRGHPVRRSAKGKVNPIHRTSVS